MKVEDLLRMKRTLGHAPPTFCYSCTHALLFLCLMVHSGCVPWYASVQPSASVLVTSVDEAPLEGANVILKTWRPFDGVASLEERSTGPTGQVDLEERGQWMAACLAPDGFPHFFWDVCVEKHGYDAQVINRVESGETVLVVLTSAGQTDEKSCADIDPSFKSSGE